MYAMTLPRNPTNLDLLYEIKEVKSIAVETRKLAQKTNGRVDKLEDRQIELDAIELYKSTHSKRSNSARATQWAAAISTALGIVYLLVEYVVKR